MRNRIASSLAFWAILLPAVCQGQTGIFRADRLEISLDQLPPTASEPVCAQVGIYFQLLTLPPGATSYSFDRSEFTLAYPGDANVPTFVHSSPQVFIRNANSNPDGVDGITNPPVPQLSVIDGSFVPCAPGDLFNTLTLAGGPEISYVDRGLPPVGSETEGGDPVTSGSVLGRTLGPNRSPDLQAGDEILLGVVVVPIRPIVGEVPLQFIPFPPNFNQIRDVVSMTTIWSLDESLTLEDGYVRVVAGSPQVIPTLETWGLIGLILALAGASTFVLSSRRRTSTDNHGR